MKNILIVDDDKTNLISAKNAIGDLYKVIAVPSGAQALRFLENNSCDLILLDINMPEMDGFEVMQKIRSRDAISQIPIIFLTADNDPETENGCLEAGAVDYIVKPFVTKVLRSRISRTLELEELRRNLAQKVEEKTERITYIQNMTVLGMATMVESRDNSTGGHIRRTGDVIKIFAQHLYNTGYFTDYEFVKNIVRAAPMHDLGKIAIDDRILRKNGNFNDEEYNTMKNHSAEGEKVIEKMLREVDEDEFVDIAAKIARHHHERWDGTGYPDKISGEAIPVEARVMALADVFDALVSKRCYKPPFPYDKAFSIIEESLGSQFDPKLGRLFLECRPQLEALYNQYEAE